VENAWARNADERHAIETELSSLIGRTPTVLRQTGGLDLVLDDGAKWSVVATSDGDNRGLLWSRSRDAPADPTERWELSGPIVGLVPDWGRTTYGPVRDARSGELLAPARSSDECLLGLILRFEDGRGAAIALAEEGAGVELELEAAVRAGRFRDETVAALGLVERSEDVLSAGVAATLSKREGRDWRDTMIALAPLHDAARRAHLDPAEVFERGADQGPAAMRAGAITFGRRPDVTLGAFGFVLEEGVLGLRYRFALRRP